MVEFSSFETAEFARATVERNPSLKFDKAVTFEILQDDPSNFPNDQGSFGSKFAPPVSFPSRNFNPGNPSSVNRYF